MQTRRTKRNYGLTMNMPPMIDVVFLLLIFFLVASQFAQVTYEQQVDLPEAESSEAPEQLAPSRHRLVVHIAADEQWTVTGAPITVEEFRQQLLRLLEEVPADELEVRVRADRTVPYRAIEPLLLTCAREGGWKVNFAVLPEPRS